MSFGGGPLIARGPEFTKVGLETEIKIPFRTWLICAAVSMVDVLSFVGILILTSRQFWNWKHPPRVYGRGWWPSVASSLAMWWPSIGIAILSGIILWSVPLLYRFLVETITKQGPQYTPYPSENGRWKPFSKGESYDEYEAEAEASSTDDQGPYIVRGEMRTGDRSVLYLEFELENYAAALKWHKFCQAVDGGKNFSYNQAVRQNHLSGKDWKRIYKAFTSQHWATKAPRRGTSELMAVGKHWITMYAKNPPLAPLPA